MKWDPSLAIIIRIPQKEKSAEESLSSNAPPVFSQDESGAPCTNTAQTVVTPEPPPYTWEEFEQDPTFPISFFLISILAYLIAVGPLDYFLTRLFRRPWLTWVTLPLWAILFTTLFYHAGRFLNLENPENSRFYREEITIAEPPAPPPLPPETTDAIPSESDLEQIENE